MSDSTAVAQDPSVADYRATSPRVAQGGTTAWFREWQLALPLALAFAALFVAPLLLLVGVSFYDDDKISQPGFASWTRFFGDPFNYKVIVDTLLLGAKTVCTTVVIGYPLALVFLDLSPRLQKVLLFMIVMPLLLSVVVRTFAWIVMLGREGVVNSILMSLGIISEPLKLLQTELGLVISLTQIEMPLMLLPLISVMSRLDPNLRDASAALGASRWRTLFRVILPLSMPGLIAGCLLVFASSTTAFISQTVIGGVRLIYLPLVIWQQALVVYHWPLAAVASLALVISVLSVVAALSWVGRRSGGSVHG
jgi:putative spermidine/putrescine transport system permease protein